MQMCHIVSHWLSALVFLVMMIDRFVSIVLVFKVRQLQFQALVIIILFGVCLIVLLHILSSTVYYHGQETEFEHIFSVLCVSPLFYSLQQGYKITRFIYISLQTLCVLTILTGYIYIILSIASSRRSVGHSAGNLKVTVRIILTVIPCVVNYLQFIFLILISKLSIDDSFLRFIGFVALFDTPLIYPCLFFGMTLKILHILHN